MTGSKYRTEIDEWMDAHLDEMTEDLKMLVRIPSVRGDAEEGKPYGKEAARVLQAMQERMAAFELKTRNYENYCVTGDLDGENEKTLDILAHLDVVPVGDGWTRPPFGGVVVTLLDVPASDAPYRTPAVEGLESEPCFDLEGYHLQVTSLENERRIRWIRWKQK